MEEIKNTCREIDIKEFADDKFECQCPRCGFRFNKKKEKKKNVETK